MANNTAALMRKTMVVLACLGLLMSFALSAGCSKGTTVVLLPDPEGKLGKVTVTNQTGTQVLSRDREMSSVEAADEPMAETRIAGQAQIQKDFGAALAAQPALPDLFILYFEHGTNRLTADSKALLPLVLKRVKKRNSVDISVVGHADTAGDEAYNAKLSRKRAQSVAQYLISHGVDPKSVHIDSHGERNLLVPTGDNVVEPKNRRVEVTVR